MKNQKGTAGIFYVLFIATLLFSLPARAEDTWPSFAGQKPWCRTSNGDTEASYLPCPIGKIPMEDVSYYVRGEWQPDTFVRFSPDGRLLAVGSYTGRIRMWDVYRNKMLWEKEIAEGMIKRIDFSKDSARVYFAEQSIDAFVYAADTKTGEIKWRFRMADDLESGRPAPKEDPYGIYRLPGCYGLKTLENGDILVLGLHSWGEDPHAEGLQATLQNLQAVSGRRAAMGISRIRAPAHDRRLHGRGRQGRAPGALDQPSRRPERRDLSL